MKVYELLESIKSVEKDSAEDSIGYWIVREKDDKAAWGPFKTMTQALNDLEHNHKGYATHGVPDDKIVYVDHGWVDEDDAFHLMDRDRD